MAEAIKTTTIKISEVTKQRLEHIKEHKEESYDTLINKTLNILNVCSRSPSLAARILRDIDKSKKRKELLDNPDKIVKKKPQTTASIMQNNLRQALQSQSKPSQRNQNINQTTRQVTQRNIPRREF